MVHVSCETTGKGESEEKGGTSRKIRVDLPDLSQFVGKPGKGKEQNAEKEVKEEEGRVIYHIVVSIKRQPVRDFTSDLRMTAHVSIEIVRQSIEHAVAVVLHHDFFEFDLENVLHKYIKTMLCCKICMGELSGRESEIKERINTKRKMW